MFGLVEWRGAGEQCGAREKRLGGVRFLAVGIRRGDGLRAVWSLRTAARTLERYGVTQAVFPRGFSAYERFAARGSSRWMCGHCARRRLPPSRAA